MENSTEINSDITNDFTNDENCMPPSSNTFVDQITMELLLNKTNYQKYLSKSEPQKYAEYQEFLENCKKFRQPISNMTISLLNNQKRSIYNQEVIDAFDTYAKTLIRYLEIKEMTDNIQEMNSNLDEDVLFPAMMDYAEEEDDNELILNSPEPKPIPFFVPPRNNRYTMDDDVQRSDRYDMTERHYNSKNK